MTSEFPYVRLPGSYRGFFRKATLWEGLDHVLSISGTRFHEEYRRFYYRDIQAIFLEKRPRAGSWVWSIILAALLILTVIAAAQNDAPYYWAAVILLLLIFAIRLEISLRRSCRCTIQTAVSREVLPALIRLKPSQATIARLEMRIAAEQGELPLDMEGSEESVAAAVLPPDSGGKPASQVLAEAAERESRQTAVRGVNFAIAAFFVLLFNSIFTFWVAPGLAYNSFFQRTSSWVGYSLIALGVVPALYALQYFARLRSIKALRAVLISLIVFAGLRVLMSLFAAPITTGIIRSGDPTLAASFQRYYVNTNGALQFGFAAAGLILIFAKWEAYRRGDVSNN